MTPLPVLVVRFAFRGPWCLVDAYDVLKLPQRATAAEIKVAYRAAARRTHPDAGGSAAAFGEVQQAYETLMDPARRTALDAQREHAARPSPHEPTSRPSSREPSTPRPRSTRRPAPAFDTPEGPPGTLAALLTQIKETLRLVLHFCMVATASAVWAASRLLLSRFVPLEGPGLVPAAQGVYARAGTLAVVAVVALVCWVEWRFAVVLRFRLTTPQVRAFAALSAFPVLVVGEYLVTRDGRLALGAMWCGLTILLATRRYREHKKRHHH